MVDLVAGVAVVVVVVVDVVHGQGTWLALAELQTDLLAVRLAQSPSAWRTDSLTLTASAAAAER